MKTRLCNRKVGLMRINRGIVLARDGKAIKSRKSLSKLKQGGKK